MAIVAAGWWLHVELVDNGGNVTSKRYQMTSTTGAEADTDAAAIITTLNAVTDAVIKSWFMYELNVEDALVLPASGVEIENLALLDFDIVDHPEKSATHTIPAPAPTIFQSTSGSGANIVDLADAAVIAYAAVFKAAGQAYLSDGEVADTLIKGKRIHRKSNRG